jgi:hypothetical protein
MGGNGSAFACESAQRQFSAGALAVVAMKQGAKSPSRNFL